MSASVQPPYHNAVHQQGLGGRAVESQQQFGVAVVLPEDPQEMESLLGHRDFVCQERSTEMETPRGLRVWTLSTHTADVERSRVYSMPPEVKDDLFCFCGVELQLSSFTFETKGLLIKY